MAGDIKHTLKTSSKKGDKTHPAKKWRRKKGKSSLFQKKRQEM